MIIFKATGVINFAQASFVLVGGYLTFNASTRGLGFFPSVVVAMIGGALLGILIEGSILRRMVGPPPFTLIMVTDRRALRDRQPGHRHLGARSPEPGRPVGLGPVTVGDVVLPVADLWSIGITAVVLLAFFAFFRYSPSAWPCAPPRLDQEAAMAQGISARTVYRASWAIAGVVAALAGVISRPGARAASTPRGLVALAAFPAMILGGLESPLGAVVGGLIIGLVQPLTARLQPGVRRLARRQLRGVALPRDDRDPPGASLRPVRHPGGPAGLMAAINPACAPPGRAGRMALGHRPRPGRPRLPRPARPARRWSALLVLYVVPPPAPGLWTSRS